MKYWMMYSQRRRRIERLIRRQFKDRMLIRKNTAPKLTSNTDYEIYSSYTFELESQRKIAVYRSYIEIDFDTDFFLLEN